MRRNIGFFRLLHLVVSLTHQNDYAFQYRKTLYILATFSMFIVITLLLQKPRKPKRKRRREAETDIKQKFPGIVA